MIYARKVENTLIIGAADTVSEYEMFSSQNELIVPEFMELLTNPLYKGLKQPPRIIEFDNEEVLHEFVTLNQIEIVKQNQLIDLNKSMVLSLKEEVNETRTISEIYGLDKHNPWDKRTPEQIEKDKLVEEKIKQAKKDGTLTSDSFDPNQNTNTGPKVTVVTVAQETGKVVSVVAHKKDGISLEIDSDLTIPHDGPIAIFHKVIVNKSLEDVSKLINIEGTVVARNTDSGSWFAVQTQRLAMEYVNLLKEAGMEADTYPVNKQGEQLLPSGVSVDEQEEEQIGPRPWSSGWDTLTSEEKEKEIKNIKPTEFYVAGFEKGLHGSEFYMVPRTYWQSEGALWTGELPVDHLLSQNITRGKKTAYFRSQMDWNRTAFVLNQVGFREQFLFQCYLNGERFVFDTENSVHR